MKKMPLTYNRTTIACFGGSYEHLNKNKQKCKI